MAKIEKETLEFLQRLKSNNNREWFKVHKEEHDAARANVDDFFKAIEKGLNKSDKIETYKIYRIYRDIRFSKDKTPFKQCISGYWSRLGEERRGSYWLRIEPDGLSRMGGGFYSPNKDDLFRLRKEFEMEPNDIEKMIRNKNFKRSFGKLHGESLKTAPKGFDKEHPAIEHIRMKNFYAFILLEDEKILSDYFQDFVLNAFKDIRPFFDYFTQILTTNLDGESVLS